MYKPYTYLIGWSKHDLWYYGSSYKNSKRGIANPSQLWDSYFTSSIIVDNVRKMYGEPDVIKIKKIFSDAYKTRIWEYKVLRRLGVSTSRKWLNMFEGRATNVSGENNPMYGKKHSEETKNKIREKRKTQIMKTGWFHTSDTKEKLSKNHADVSGVNNPNWGKKRTDKENLNNSKARNPTTHNFYNENIGKVSLSVYEMSLKFNLSKSSLKGLVSGRLKTLKGWRIISPP